MVHTYVYEHSAQFTEHECFLSYNLPSLKVYR